MRAGERLESCEDVGGVIDVPLGVSDCDGEGVVAGAWEPEGGNINDVVCDGVSGCKDDSISVALIEDEPVGCCDPLRVSVCEIVSDWVAVTGWLAVRACVGDRVPVGVSVMVGVDAEDGVVVSVVDIVAVIEPVTVGVLVGDIVSLEVAEPLTVDVWLGVPTVIGTVINPICMPGDGCREAQSAHPNTRKAPATAPASAM